MKYVVIIFSVTALLILGLLGLNEIKRNNLLENSGLKGLEVRDLIERLEENDYTGEVKSSITDQEVRLIIEDYEYKFSLPEDMLYISFAPYTSLTHECYTHSLTGCQGEMVNEEIYVIIYDEEDNILSEGFYNTGEDGFIGLFLNSNEQYRILVSSNFLASEFMVDGSLDQTCFTEVELT